MFLNSLNITNFRNLKQVTIEPSPGFNFICGTNGAGKTAFLEAIGYLALGRSFLGMKYQYLIRHGEQALSLHATIKEDADSVSSVLGLYRPKVGAMSLKLNDSPVTRLVDFVDAICVQIIHPQGIDLVTKEAEGRRNFIDWGVYYTDPAFKDLWSKYTKLLKYRNSALHMASLRRRDQHMKRDGYLRSSYSQRNPERFEGLDRFQCFEHVDEVTLYDKEFVRLAELITEKRLTYLRSLWPILEELLHEFLPKFKLNFSLYPGWDSKLDLVTVMAQKLERDKLFGYTLYGCHRADLKIKQDSLSAGATLSRGQLKMLVYALRLAQGMLLKQQTGRSCIYLIDDLDSELDSQSQRKLLTTLLKCNHQVFISNIHHKNLSLEDSSDYKIFNLDDGKISF